MFNKSTTWKLEKKGNKPIWNEYVNTRTGERSLEIHTKKTILDSSNCNHYYERIDTAGNVCCKHCHIGTRIITGIHNLTDGNIEVIKR